MGINTPGVPYYGMLAFAVALAGSSKVLPIDFDPQNINLTSYACGNDREPHAVIVINRDPLQDARLSLAELRMGDLIAYRLLSPSSGSKSGVTFGGSSVDADGPWAPGSLEHIRDARLTVPRMTAVVLRSSLQTR